MQVFGGWFGRNFRCNNNIANAIGVLVHWEVVLLFLSQMPPQQVARLYEFYPRFWERSGSTPSASTEAVPVAVPLAVPVACDSHCHLDRMRMKQPSDWELDTIVRGCPRGKPEVDLKGVVTSCYAMLPTPEEVVLLRNRDVVLSWVSQADLAQGTRALSPAGAAPGLPVGCRYWGSGHRSEGPS